MTNEWVDPICPKDKVFRKYILVHPNVHHSFDPIWMHLPTQTSFSYSPRSTDGENWSFFVPKIGNTTCNKITDFKVKMDERYDRYLEVVDKIKVGYVVQAQSRSGDLRKILDIGEQPKNTFFFGQECQFTNKRNLQLYWKTSVNSIHTIKKIWDEDGNLIWERTNANSNR